MKTQQELNVKTVRRKLVFALIVCIIVTDSLIVFTPQEKRLVVGDIVVPTSIIIATALSLIVVYRQKMDGLIGKAYAFLALGLTLWCIAEILWSITEIVFGQKRPFPSISDGLWLVAYGPLIYYAFRMYNAFHKSSSSKFSIVLISICVAAYLLYTIPLTASTFELSKQEDVYLFLISISYSILDMVFIFPASLIILNAPKRGIGGDLTSIPWIFLAMVVIAVADIVFGFTSVADLDRLEWTSTPIYSAGYLLMAVGLFWHNRFFIFDEKKVNENWQKENR